MRFATLSILLFCTALSLAAPPDAWIAGKVRDARSGEALVGASILFGQARGTVTDTYGHFAFSHDAGVLQLRVQFMGYKTFQQALALERSDSLWLDIQLEPEVTQINMVVVSASRVEQRIAETTVSMSVIRPQDFQAAQISDAHVLINKTSGIEVLDGQASVRGGSGFSYGAGSRVLTLVDGMPVLAADAGNIRWQFLPLENLSQIEIIKGASSVLYGSSALNGVINFRTAAAGEKAVTQFFLESGLYDSPRRQAWKWWNSPRGFSSASFSHLQKYGRTEVALGSFLMHDAGYRRLNHESLGRMSLQIRQHSRTHPGLSMGLNTHLGYTDKRDFLLWEDAWQGALQQSPSTSTNLQGSYATLTPFIRFRPNAQRSHDLRMRLQYSGNRFSDAPNNESDAFSAYTEYQTWRGLNAALGLNAGLVHQASWVRSAFYGDHQATNLAAYLQADMDASQRLKLVSGLRLEYNVLDGEADKLVPLFRAGLNYQALKYTFLRTSWGQGYRYPSVAEKHAATSLGAVRIFPNPYLQAESGWNTELAVRQGLALGLWSGMVDMALFYAQNKDLIEYRFGLYPDPLTGMAAFGFRADNTEYSRVYGLELEFLLAREQGRWTHTLTGGYVYTYPVEFDPGTLKNTGAFLKYRRKHAAKLGISSSWKQLRWGVDVYLRSAMLNIDEVFLDELTREDILPGFYDYWNEQQQSYVLADAHMAWRFTKQYTLSLAVKNLGNTEYMGRPGDIQPQRHYSLRLSARF